MKIVTFKKFNFTADLYTFTVTTDGEGGDVRTYNLNREVKVHVAPSNQGRLFVHFKAEDDDIEVNDQLFNLSDPLGTQIAENAIYQLSLVEPLLDMFGRRIGFKARAELVGYDG